MANKNDQLVVGLYANPESAKDAADAIKFWDKKDNDVKLGAIAVITYDHKKDKLHYDEIGQRGTKRGAGWGTALGAAVAVLSGGVALIPGLVVGAAAGGALGALNHRSLGISDEQKDKLMAALKRGGAGLGVMADDFEVEPVIAHMAESGGDVAHYRVEAEVAEAITMAAVAQVAASEAVEDAVEAVHEDVAKAAEVVAAEAPDLNVENAEVVSKIVAVTGLSVDDANSLYDVGIEKASDLLEVAALPDGRAAICEATGLDSDVVLYSAKRLDLMRVKGVGTKYSALLIASGVDTVPELGNRNPANLAAKMENVNEAKAITDAVPSEKETADWVGQAKEMPRMLYY